MAMMEIRIQLTWCLASGRPGKVAVNLFGLVSPPRWYGARPQAILAAGSRDWIRRWHASNYCQFFCEACFWAYGMKRRKFSCRQKVPSWICASQPNWVSQSQRLHMHMSRCTVHWAAQQWAKAKCPHGVDHCSIPSRRYISANHTTAKLSKFTYH